MGVEKSQGNRLFVGGKSMKNILYFAKRIHSFAGKSSILNLIGMLLISLFDGVGIFLLIPLISLTGILDVSLRRRSFIY